MKLENIGHFGVMRWRAGWRNVGNWSVQDMGNQAHGFERHVLHHGTHMGTFRSADLREWEFVPVSTGWGSVSDQQGMNKMLAGYGWRYVRKGGARYERIA
jgi:hypothetical protein